MELAKKIIEREIKQRELANTHKGNLRYVVIKQELRSLKKSLQLVNNFVLDPVSDFSVCMAEKVEGKKCEEQCDRCFLFED